MHPYYKWTICSQIDFERHVTIIFRVCGIQAIWILGDSDLFIHPLSTLMNMHEDNHGWENIRQSWQNGHLHYDKQFIVLHLVGYWLSQIIYFSREIFKIYPDTYLVAKLASYQLTVTCRIFKEGFLYPPWGCFYGMTFILLIIY